MNESTAEEEELSPIQGVKAVNGKLSSNDFKVIQSALEMNNIEMAERLGMSTRIVVSMRSGERDVASWTQKLLEYIATEEGYFF